MQKGKFGFRTWLYPFIALWGGLVGPTWLPFAVLGFVLALEQDPWAGRQCFRVVLFHFYWLFYIMIRDMVLGLPVIGLALAIPVAIAHFVVNIVLIVFVFVKGTSKLKRGEELTIPGGKISDLAYDRIQAAAPTYAPPQYQQQYQQQQYQPPQYQQPPQPQQAPPPAAPPPTQPPAQEGFTPPPPPPPVPGGANPPQQ